MGPLPCDINPAGVAYPNDWPVCSFDQGVNLLNVEWYTKFQDPAAGPAFFLPNAGGYIGLQMNNVGAVTSPLDYLQVGEFATASNTMASNTPNIASSRQNDRTDYQFVAFVNQNAAGNYIVVKDRVWASPTFKVHIPQAPGHQFMAAPQRYKNVASIENNDLIAYPNPFTKQYLTRSVSRAAG